MGVGEIPITAAEVEEVLADCPKGESPGLDGLRYELYKSMPELFAGLLAEAYSVWQQNGRIPSCVSRGEVNLVRKEPSSGDNIFNFRPITIF